MNDKPLTGYPSIDKPWMKYYEFSTSDLPTPECTIYEYLWENNKDYPNDIAIQYFNQNISYKELFENIDKVAKALLSIGVRENDIVTVAMPSMPEALYAVYAINKIGAVANMIHPLAGRREIVNYLNEVQSSVFLMYTGTYEILKDAIRDTKVMTAVIVSPTDSLPAFIRGLNKLKSKVPKIPVDSVYMNWRKFLKLGENTTLKPVKRGCRELAVISHTGGTTGEPKGVMCSNYNIISLIHQISINMEYERQEKYMSVLPPFINYSLINSMLEPLSWGFQIVLIPEYLPNSFAKYIEKYHPNHISSIPAYWEAVLDDDKLKEMDLSCLNHIYYGGESMLITKENAVNEILLSRGAQHPLSKGLGSTEMTSAATITFENCNVPGSAGIPLVDVNVMIVDPESTKEQTYNEVGEICFSGPTVMMGYYKNPEATDEVIKIHKDRQRWLHTGDLGYINEEGLLFVTGRIKRIIMTKGKDQQVTKLFPDRIEKVINSHPAVNLCCVIGVPDHTRINYAKAVMELNEGFTQSDELKGEIRSFCQGKLPEYQIPDEIEFIAELPRTERGKVDYRAL